MSNKARRMLVLLLIILKEAGATQRWDSTCSSSCSSDCWCFNRGLSSVPQDLPTYITQLHLYSNAITTLNQSDFSRYRSLTWLHLGDNQISMIHNKTFHDLTSLTYLNLHDNHLTTLPADIFVGLGNLRYLSLHTNQLTSLSADIFVGLGNLQELWLYSNQLTSLSADIFVGLGNLQRLYLENNQLTSLPADIFGGLGNLNGLRLQSNNIHSIEAGTFNDTTKLTYLFLQNNNISTITADTFGNLLQIKTLFLSGNNINTFPVEALSNLNISVLSELTLDNNQLETLPVMAYDILAYIPIVNIANNPWQCDCRMAPFKQRMSGSYRFEDQIRCARPANLTGQLLRDVNPEDLICEETTPVYSTSSTKHIPDSTDPPFASNVTLTESTTGPADGGIVLSVPLVATLGAIFGLLLICTIAFAVWRMYKRRQRDPPHQGFSNTNPTGTSSGHDQIRLQAVGTSAEVNSQSETSHSDTDHSEHVYDAPIYEGPDVSAGPQGVVYDYENEDEIESTKEGPQSHKHENSQVTAAAKYAAAGPQDAVYGNDDETARLITLASQIDEELVDNQSQIAAAPGADNPHHYEPLRNPSSQQQHTYTSLMPHGSQHN
ncbi:PREDICTED: carboxypeptidase N subunit 2-like isoform X1 [Branchiostoma belcheri]|uniref:Carboxypeptidase N subunit 2-like isoform X1 n=1 Tax=Branchiostoma belcheri TaxID=7741 RepID=A0A6P4YYJ6_BRABE|nr:PREDICTED: carboxypeptidase N subunit 2-like isoform X1 [Branchiostoma belcheri]